MSRRCDTTKLRYFLKSYGDEVLVSYEAGEGWLLRDATDGVQQGKGLTLADAIDDFQGVARVGSTPEGETPR